MEETALPRDKILTLLHEALTTTRADAEQFEQRLISLYRDEERPESTEQVVALGFLACTKALREASLMQEIAIREELQELHGLRTGSATETVDAFAQGRPLAHPSNRRVREHSPLRFLSVQRRRDVHR